MNTLDTSSGCISFFPGQRVTHKITVHDTVLSMDTYRTYSTRPKSCSRCKGGLIVGGICRTLGGRVILHSRKSRSWCSVAKLLKTYKRSVSRSLAFDLFSFKFTDLLLTLGDGAAVVPGSTSLFDAQRLSLSTDRHRPFSSAMSS